MRSKYGPTYKPGLYAKKRRNMTSYDEDCKVKSYFSSSTQMPQTRRVTNSCGFRMKEHCGSTSRERVVLSGVALR